MNESLEELRRSGKPFFWVDHERLKKLKQLCETNSEEAKNALWEYKDIIDNYNYSNKRKITDIFEVKSSMHKAKTDKLVNIKFLDSQMPMDSSDGGSNHLIDVGKLRS